VFVVLGIQHAMCMRGIIICGLPVSAVFSHFISQRARFSENKILERKCLFWIFLRIFWNISHSKRNWARYDKKCLLVFKERSHFFYPILIKYEYFGHIFEYTGIAYFIKIPPIKRICSKQTDRRTDGQIDMTKLIATFRNFTNVPKMRCIFPF